MGRVIARVLCLTLLLALNTSAVFSQARPIVDEACADHQCACSTSGERTSCCCSGMTLPKRYGGPVYDELCMPGSPKLSLFAKPGLQPRNASPQPLPVAQPTTLAIAPTPDCRAGFRNLPDKVPIATS